MTFWVFPFVPSVKGAVLQSRWCGCGIRRGLAVEPWARNVVPEDNAYVNEFFLHKTQCNREQNFILRRAGTAMLSKLVFELKLEEEIFGCIEISF